MGLFNKLYAIKEEAKSALKKAPTERKIRRQFEAAIDSLETSKIEHEEKLDKARYKIAQGEGDDNSYKALAEAKIALVDIELQIKTLSEERDAFFAEESAE
jgi:hypothetical protein